MNMTRSYDNKTWVAKYFPFSQPVLIVSTSDPNDHRWALGYNFALEPNGDAYEWLTEGGWLHFEDFRIVRSWLDGQ